MTISIIGCGDTAKDWIPRGHTLGVNDSWKWGKPTDSLVICNRPTNFTNDRLKTIVESKPKTFYSHKSNWAYVFPAWQRIRLKEWIGDFQPRMDKLPLGDRHCYYSNTISFIALSLCYQLGATEIIMWGCDFVNHKLFHAGNPETEKEVRKHLELIRCLNDHGVKVWLGAEVTAFDGKLEVYEEFNAELYSDRQYEGIDFESDDE